MSELILYTNEDGRSQIKLRAKLFDATRQNILLHLKKLFQDGEPDPAAAVKESLTAQFARLCVEDGLCVIAGTPAEASSVVHGYRGRWP